MASTNDKNEEKTGSDLAAEALKEDLATLRRDLAAMAEQVGELVKGYVREARDEASERVGKARDKAGEAMAEAAAQSHAARECCENLVRKQPITALVSALGVGFLLGLVWRR